MGDGFRRAAAAARTTRQRPPRGADHCNRCGDCHAPAERCAADDGML